MKESPPQNCSTSRVTEHHHLLLLANGTMLHEVRGCHLHHPIFFVPTVSAGRIFLSITALIDRNVLLVSSSNSLLTSV